MGFLQRGKRDLSNNGLEAVHQSQVDAIEVMAKTDPSQCFNMILCQLSASDSELTDSPLSPIANVVEFSDHKSLPPHLSKYKYELEVAMHSGLSSRVCQSTYKCPISTHQFNKLVQRQMEAVLS